MGRLEDSLAAVARLVASLESAEPTLVAIDGMAGSGKSTLTAAYSRAHPDVVVIHGDELFGPEVRNWRAWTAEQGYQRFADHADLERYVLVPLRAGEPATFGSYDWSRRGWAGSRRVQPQGVVMIEGGYLLKPRLRCYWDASIFVAAPPQTRRDRLAAREEGDPGWTEHWAAAEEHYLAVDRPDIAADLVVRGW